MMRWGFVIWMMMVLGTGAVGCSKSGESATGPKSVPASSPVRETPTKQPAVIEPPPSVSPPGVSPPTASPSSVSPPSVSPMTAVESKEKPPQSIEIVPRHSIEGVAFSSTGERLATVGEWDQSRNYQIAIWDTETGNASTKYRKHKDIQPYVLEFSPDDTVLASGDRSGDVYTWQEVDGAPVFSPLRHKGPIRDIRFSPSGDTLLVITGDRCEFRRRGQPGETRLWNARTGKAITDPMLHPSSVYKAKFAPSGDRFATVDDSGMILVRKTVDGTDCVPPITFSPAVQQLLWSKDSSVLVATVWFPKQERMAVAWDCDTGKQLSELTINDRIIAAAFDQGGEHVVLVGETKGVVTWDPRADKFQTLGPDAFWHRAEVSPSGEQVALANEEGMLLYHVGKQSIIGERIGPRAKASALAWSSDGAIVAMGDKNGDVRFIDGQTGRQIGDTLSYPPSRWIDGEVGLIRFTAADKRLVTAIAGPASIVTSMPTLNDFRSWVVPPKPRP